MERFVWIPGKIIFLSGDAAKRWTDFSKRRKSQYAFNAVIGAAPYILWSRFSWHTRERFLYCWQIKGSSYQFNHGCCKITDLLKNISHLQYSSPSLLLSYHLRSWPANANHIHSRSYRDDDGVKIHMMGDKIHYHMESRIMPFVNIINRKVIY